MNAERLEKANANRNQLRMCERFLAIFDKHKSGEYNRITLLISTKRACSAFDEEIPTWLMECIKKGIELKAEELEKEFEQL